MASVLLGLCLAYVMGSLPTALLVSRWVFKKDIREFGSGNMGGTNTFRVFGAKWGVFVAVVDIGKGALAPLMVPALIPTPFWPSTQLWPLLCGLAAVMGHVWSVFAHFRGGKGVATSLGVMLVLYPKTAVVLLGIFFLAFKLAKVVSLASIIAMGSFPFFLLLMKVCRWEEVSGAEITISFAISLFILYTHRTNIKRLWQGKETKFYGHDPQSLKKEPE